MAVEFTSTMEASEFVNVLVYGKSGAGKTLLCATAPKPVIISTENGLLSIKKAKVDLPVLKIATLDDLKETLRIVKKRQAKFKTVCLDCLSDIAEAVLADLRNKHKDPRAAYGELNSEMSALIRKFRDLPMHTYFIAKAEIYENELGLSSVRPSMPGKTLTTDLPYFFDEVLYLDTELEDEENKKVRRWLWTTKTSTIEAKDRSGALSTEEKLHLGRLFKKLKGE